MSVVAIVKSPRAIRDYPLPSILSGDTGPMPSPETLIAATDLLRIHQLINSCENARVLAMSANEFPFRAAIDVCDSVHLHVKVDDANSNELARALEEACELEYRKKGFVKYRFPGSVNLIFSSIPVSEDELVETDDHKRPRPFLDHIGIDLRREDQNISMVFAEIPVHAHDVGWAVSSQGCSGQGVHCCHVEVKAKHWVYPCKSTPTPHIPLEFAFGALKVNDVSGGCDLRPMDPIRKQQDGVTIPACHR